MPFSTEVRTKALLWCDRHCCLFRKACGPHIEIDHIIQEAQGGPNEIGNAIPLCYECHAIVHMYNDEHPRGTKYKPDELRARLEQVYEEYTRHLVPPVFYQFIQLMPNDLSRRFPDVGFTLAHQGDALPVQVRTVVDAILDDGKRLRLEGHYAGEKVWHLNPRFTISGHTQITPAMRRANDSVVLEVAVTVIDQYEREHNLLPVQFVYVPEGNY